MSQSAHCCEQAVLAHLECGKRSVSNLPHQVENRRWLYLAFGLFGLLGCGSIAQTVFDVPQTSEPGRATLARDEVRTDPSLLPFLEPPPIEATLNRDSMLAMLPRDPAGHVDWVAAVDSGIIRPRSSPGQAAGAAPNDGFAFDFDFYLPGPSEMFDAYFPHSAHTKVLACQHCHPRIFPRRNMMMTMHDINEGKFCGECHGKVAFPVATGCDRCHPAMELPPGRATAELLGDIAMIRAGGDTALAKGVRVEEVAPTVFPHSVHRVRYKCATCHPVLFEPKAGANTITMDDINSGKACGVCHNDRIAFRPTFDECHRCHVNNNEDAPDS